VEHGSADTARIRPPVFADRDFDVTKFGAAGDGKVDCTQAFQKAIATCAAAGGGRVVIPAGEFSTGAIHLKSKVNLHLASGAVVRFTRDPHKYPLVFTRWEGVELMNYSPLIYAFEQHDIAITGDGTLDGNAIASTGGRGRGVSNVDGAKVSRNQNAIATRSLRWLNKAFPSVKECLAKATTCGRNLFSPIAAGTC